MSSVLAQKPIMLDDIHYYTPQRKTTVDWFINNFGAKPMAEVSSNPLTFITFLEISHGQSTINVSPPGPFPGIRVGDPKRWEKEAITPAKDLPPMYGVHWIGMSVPNLKDALKSLNANGVENATLPQSFALSKQKSSKSALIWGPDYNRILLVEHKKTVGNRIDHLLLLVSDLEANIKFFQQVLSAEILEQSQDFARIQVAKHEFILAKPAYLGLKDEDVIKRHPKKFTPNIDHLGFLYATQDELKRHRWWKSKKKAVSAE